MFLDTSSKSVSFGETTILSPVYDAISKDFVSKFTNSLNFGMGFVASYFDPNVMCTLHIRHSQSSEAYETIGYSGFQNKLTALGVQKLTYGTYVQTSQPVGDNVLTTLVGQLNINDQQHSFEAVYILRRVATNYVIVNHILQIFI
jgi:hypothetical protein